MAQSKFQRSGFFTSSGTPIIIDEPWACEVSIYDISWALARTCRFGRHLRYELEHYSVAQHSVIVAEILEAWTYPGSELAKVGLLHDGEETYCMDLIRPLKRVLAGSEYQSLANMWKLRIGHEFGLGNKLRYVPELVHDADNVALATEIRDMYFSGIEHEVGKFVPLSTPIVPLGPKAAQELFMNKFATLFTKSLTDV